MALHRHLAAHQGRASGRPRGVAGLRWRTSRAFRRSGSGASASYSWTACSRRSSRPSPGCPTASSSHRLAAALGAHAAVIEPHLARHVGVRERRLRGAQYGLPARRGLHPDREEPANARRRCSCCSFRRRAEAAAYPRCLVIAEAGSECTLIEDYVGLADGVYFNNAVTEIVVGRGRPRAARAGCSARRPARFTSPAARSALGEGRPLRVARGHARRAPVAAESRRACSRARAWRSKMDGLALISRAPARRHAHPDGPRAPERAAAGSCTSASSAARRTRCSTARSWCGRARS